MNTKNNNAMDFAAEELETRAEMQMLGFGANPSLTPDGVIVPVIDPHTGAIVFV